MRQTTILKAEEVKKAWYVIDAEGQRLPASSEVNTNLISHQTLTVVIM